MSTEKIRELNDAFRRTLIGGRVLLTRGIVGRSDTAAIIEAVQKFDRFTPENDPYSIHDMGGVEVGRDTVLWKIDFYSNDLLSGSEDPSDPEITTRVLTIMLAEEY